jgi:hypothetical protein
MPAFFGGAKCPLPDGHEPGAADVLAYTLNK